jgi:hypothetical protein
MSLDERYILRTQIQALWQELDRALRKFDELKSDGAQQEYDEPRFRDIDDKLLERVDVLMDTHIGELQQGLDELRQGVENGEDLAECWDTFRIRRYSCTVFFREYLALMEGALVRSAGLDDGLCDIADALLRYLSQRADIYWGRFTVLAEGEFYGHMAQVVRLRFPAESIWSLPVAAHEFGHFVGPEVKVQNIVGEIKYPFQKILEQEKLKNQRSWHYTHEHFADLFATFALGPAYACTCILLRFDPGTAYEDTEKHPSGFERVVWILGALKRMDEEIGGEITRPYEAIVQFLENLWKRCVQTSGQSENSDKNSITLPDGAFKELYQLLRTRLPKVQYDSFERAKMLSNHLRPDCSTTPKPQFAYTLPDVLNAAWLSRIEHWDEGSHAMTNIGMQAIELCRGIS